MRLKADGFIMHSTHISERVDLLYNNNVNRDSTLRSESVTHSELLMLNVD